MRQLILAISLTLILSFPTLSHAAVPMPPTPSDEQKAQWKKMGEENEKKYGTGGVAVPPPTVKTPSATPTFTPTPSPTPTPTLTMLKRVQNSTVSLWQSFLKSIGLYKTKK